MSSSIQSKSTALRIKLRGVIGASMLATLPILMACESSDSTKTVGQKLDIAVAKTEQAASDVKDATKASIDSASAALRDGAEQAKEAAERAGTNINVDAEDVAITASVSAGLMKDPDLSALKIDVDTKQRVVSLYGPAPSELARERATAIAKAVKGVTAVDNKLTVKTG
jgi:hyperosmotically inducible periplasmic protein